MAVENPRLVVLREEVNKRVLFCRVLVLMVDPDRVEQVAREANKEETIDVLAVPVVKRSSDVEKVEAERRDETDKLLSDRVLPDSVEKERVDPNIEEIAIVLPDKVEKMMS